MTDASSLSEALQQRLAQLSPERRALLERQLGVFSDGGTSEHIRRRPVGAGPAPLSYSQELLWRLGQSMPDLVAYNVPRVLRITGSLDIEALRGALDALVARHEVLRTRFVDTNEGLRQMVGPPATVPLDVVDLSHLPPGVARDHGERLVVEHTRYRFDLTQDLQLRGTLVRVQDGEHLLLLLSHHIVCDEWSRDVLFRDLGALYNALRARRAVELPLLVVQYSDYAAWQRDAIERGSLAVDMAFWREQLRGLPPLELPTDRPRGVVPSFAGERRRYLIGGSTLEALKRFSRTQDATLFMTLMAAYQLLLARYSGQDDFAVGTPITTRRQLELEELIGYFPNVLVVRAPLAGDPTFAELVRRVRQSCLAAYEHEDVPLEKLALEVRDGDYTPLFQTWFVLQAGDATAVAFDGAVVEPLPIDFHTAKFDVALVAAERADGLQVTVEYRTALYDAETIDRFVDHLRSILEQVAREPDRPVSRVQLMGVDELGRVLAGCSGVRTAYPPCETLLDLLELQAARTPQSVAVEAEGDALTYAELHVRADAVGRWLSTQGVGPGSLVGVFVERSNELLVALIGVLKAGAAYVPLDPEYPADRLAFMLEDAGAAVLLTQQRLLAVVPVYAGVTLAIDRDWDQVLAASARGSLARPRAEDPAYMIYTSGSTGRPKGAINAHRGIANRLRWMQDEYHLTPADVVLQKTPASFDVSVWEFFWPLISGARVVMAKPGGHRDADYLADIIAHRGVTVLHFVPSMLAAFLEEQALDARCATVRDVICSGEALPVELTRRFFAALPHGRLHNLYGPTEAAVDVSFFACRHDETRATVPIGRPVANTRLYVLDTHREPVPIGVQGELYIGGVQVGLGYHNRPELTVDRFVPDPFVPDSAARMYRTGDRARWMAGGTLEFLGRMDLQVKLRGQRVELGEIEAALAEHPAVQQAVAMVHQDDEGEQRLVGYIVPKVREADGEGDDGTREKWQTIFDETYAASEAKPAAEVESGFNIAGWISSYDLRPIPADEMREWVESTCDQIRDLAPKRVLEIGCGTGLILFRIAPYCETYCGVDISAAGLCAIEADPAMRGLTGVTLRQAEAHELADLEPGSFDTIVLNSVVQYFPSVEYLLDVLDVSLRLLAPGGALFLGDIRSLPLLEAFHASVVLANAADDLPLAEVRGRVEQTLAQESELVVDPAFFEAIRSRFPRITDCALRLKAGRACNELTRFRYDVVLRTDGLGGNAAGDSTGPGATPAGLEDISAALGSRPHALRLTDLRNARVARDVRAVELLYGTGGSVRQLTASLDGQPLSGFEPADLASIDPAYDVELLCPASDLPDRFDAVLRLRGVASSGAASAIPSAVRALRRPWRDFVHHPSLLTFDSAQVQEWRAYLSNRLPDFMVPSMFVRLDQIPHTPSGKTDRRALRPPEFTRIARNTVAPRTDTEREVAAIWAEVLRIDAVGVEDGFLDLGGHSLLAMRVIGRIRRDLGVSLPLADLLRGATVAQLAATVDAARAVDITAPDAADEEPALAPVARDGYRRGASSGRAGIPQL